jgi:NarL family two-component system response regulator LiaR
VKFEAEIEKLKQRVEEQARERPRTPRPFNSGCNSGVRISKFLARAAKRHNTVKVLHSAFRFAPLRDAPGLFGNSYLGISSGLPFIRPESLQSGSGIEGVLSPDIHYVCPVLEAGAPQGCGLQISWPPVTLPRESAPSSRRRAVRDILLYGVCGGVLIAVLKLTEYRFLVVEHSVEIYVALVAALFAGLGIWLGLTLTRKKPTMIIKEIPAQAADPFVADEARVSRLGITARELEILGLIATGLSNREIADRLFVSENTVKTHSSRLFDKLGAKRRTQAVQIGKTARLIP